MLQLCIENRESFLLQVLGILDELNALRSELLCFKAAEPTMELLDLFIEMLQERDIAYGQILLFAMSWA